MFVINEDGSGDEKIFEYNLSTAFDVSSASYSTSFTTGTNGAGDEDLSLIHISEPTRPY